MRAEGEPGRTGALNAVERVIARAMWRYLVRRGWAVQLNTPDRGHDVYEADDGRKLDRGWSPLASIRYGETPVYRGPGDVRWIIR